MMRVRRTAVNSAPRASSQHYLRTYQDLVMAKLGLLIALTCIVGGLTFARLSEPQAQTAPPCVTKDFKTQMAKEACAKGGQKAAKEAMKAWNKEKKIKSCNLCHAKLAPSYELKKTGLAEYKKLGGK